jgi:hypothetical protein
MARVGTKISNVPKCRINNSLIQVIEDKGFRKGGISQKYWLTISDLLKGTLICNLYELKHKTHLYILIIFTCKVSKKQMEKRTSQSKVLWWAKWHSLFHCFSLVTMALKYFNYFIVSNEIKVKTA